MAKVLAMALCLMLSCSSLKTAGSPSALLNFAEQPHQWPRLDHSGAQCPVGPGTLAGEGLNLLKEEELIKPAYEGLQKVIFSDQTESLGEPYKINVFDASKLAKKWKTIEEIRNANESTRTKLYLCYVNQKKVFHQIRDRYMDIFPQVEDVKVEPLDVKEEGIPQFFKDLPFIQIKEKQVDKWFEQGAISSGMLRTLLHLSEIYLCKEGTVFLIDEFENSLGINCIDELTNDIVQSKRDIQFIITSHHPYIINNINPSNWKLVTRVASVVKTEDVTKYNFSKSKHDAFMQLLQLEAFQSGRA
ncbi:MAG: ATP-binding protein [Flavobacteriales bacterium]|nr:ATP-binding protein [Flavobacteriales bacterium]